MLLLFIVLIVTAKLPFLILFQVGLNVFMLEVFISIEIYITSIASISACVLFIQVGTEGFKELVWNLGLGEEGKP
jgi:hypothetical protein